MDSFKEQLEKDNRKYFADLLADSPADLGRLWDEYQIYKGFYEAFLDYKAGIKQELHADGPGQLPVRDYIRLKVGSTSIHLNESKRGVDHTVPIRTESYSDALAFFVSKSNGNPG